MFPKWRTDETKDTGTHNSFNIKSLKKLTGSPNGICLFSSEAECFESRNRCLVVISFRKCLGWSLVRVMIICWIACQFKLLQLGVGTSTKELKYIFIERLRINADNSLHNKSDKFVSYLLRNSLDIEEALNRGTHLIKAVETSFAGLLFNDSRLLEQKIGDNTANWVVFEIKFNVHVFSEATGVVVPVSFSVPEALQDRIALNEDVLDSEI